VSYHHRNVGLKRFFHLPKFLLLSLVFAYIYILQGSVEMHLPCGGIYRVVQKKAQSLWHHNFTTVRHIVMRFSAKCSERNCLHEWSQCLNAAVKYSLFLPLASKLFENSITLDIVVYKTCYLCFFE